MEAVPQAIENPILTGFNPDPSILRVGDDHFIATSTFEWFPGVQIHHSRDLVHWHLRTRPLTRRSQLDLIGNPRSGGIWAPCLSYSDGLFHLVYTDVKNWGRAFCDPHNYLTVAESIDGPWSEPIALNSSGFDASLFHDDDGRKWLVNMLWDHRAGHNPFAGILLQEYSPRERRLVGPVRNIFKGTGRGLTEGPHIYKRHGFYYLMVAEGGTSWDHSVSLARASHIEGPYEIDPEAPLLTSIDAPEVPLQKAGHASLVETRTGDWYLAHLCGRPIGDKRRCPLGRETALQKVIWTDDGWLRLAQGGHTPVVSVPAPALAPCPFPAEPARDDFDSAALGLVYQTLRRVPSSDWMSLTERPGFLRLRGQESPRSAHSHSLVARRLQSCRARFQTRVEVSPQTFQQMAGLICFYDDENFFYLAVTHDETLGRCLQVLASDLDKYSEPLPRPLALAPLGPVSLRADFQGERLTFSFSENDRDWHSVGVTLDATVLSDENTTKGIGFTGTFVGLCAHDISGAQLIADFDYFECVENPV